MTRDYGLRNAAPLTSWLKWLPILAIVFSLLFFDTWLNVQARLNDYEIEKLNDRIMELEKRLCELKVDEVRLVAMNRIEARAPELGLVEPGPSQVRLVYHVHPGRGSAGPSIPSYELADLAHSPDNSRFRRTRSKTDR